MFKGIDLYSDTATRPSLAMKQAMMAAEVGDEQRGEDPTTRQLEEMAAEMLGHEAAMFFPSATMANEIALRLQAEPGDELIAADECHLFFAEAGGPAIHVGLMCRPIQTTTGIFTGEDLRAIYRWSKGPHYPVSKIVNVENTTNMNGGIAWDLDSLKSVITVANELGMKKHLDGSRLFNAAVKTAVSAKTIAAPFDTVTVCLSKGLGCPVGAILAYPKAQFDKVRRLKQLFGGAMRQSGILAAAGIYALQNNIERLAIDHQHATKLAERLHEHVPQVHVENIQPSTNMVFFSLNNAKLTPTQFNDACVNKGLRFSVMGQNRFRAVTHLDISAADIDKAVAIIKEILE